MKKSFILILLFLAGGTGSWAQPNTAYKVQDHYRKMELNIPMRDGKKLYTAVFVPKDTTQVYPFLIKRTPYSCGPYGADKFPALPGPQGDTRFVEEGYIFVCQDVRGRFMSEGTFTNMTPAIPNTTGHKTVDESTDTYDTVEYLLKNVPHNNGRVGLHGISYPGFYAAASIINGHPAIKASSPQAPIGDWFAGDDFHANGAFYLQDAFNFFGGFEHPEPTPTQKRGRGVEAGIDDAYTFFLRLGALKNANDRYFKGRVDFWNTFMKHGTYDTFWQERNIIPHMKGIQANVMTVIGTYDAEDPHGGAQIYQSIRKNNPTVPSNRIVIGPWFHGGWERSKGDFLGNTPFYTQTAAYYRQSIDLPFFNYYLKGKGDFGARPNVMAYASGQNKWYEFESWPPQKTKPMTLFFGANGQLSDALLPTGNSRTSWVSDPAKPVPYTQEITNDRTREYMAEDQRFAARRPDVLVFESQVLTEDLTVAGPIQVKLFASTTGTDADFVVKLVDVYPDDTPELQEKKEKYMNVPLSAFQQLVRYTVMRGKFRKDLSKPVPFVPNQVTEVSWASPHIFHTFKKGHRIMVQVQSSFFPLIDRNPQVFTDIYQASDADFKVQTHTLYHNARYPSSITLGLIETKK